jgi:thymidylate kinase
MGRKFNPLSCRKTLENKDFLDYAIKNKRERERIRRNFVVVIVAGTHGAGKSNLTDRIFADLSAQYSVLSSRASIAADRILRENRRKLLKRQSGGSSQWYDVATSLRIEAASALENEILPFMEEHSRNPEKGLIILNRYPPADTLAKQYLAGAPLEGVTQKLRGESAYREPSGYINPDLTLILTCNGNEALQRAIHRQKHVRTEQSVHLGPEFAERVESERKAYLLVSGYTQSGTSYEANAKTFPGEVHLFDTTIPDLSYNDPEKALEEVGKQAEERRKKIIRDIILPKLERRSISQGNGGKKQLR